MKRIFVLQGKGNSGKTAAIRFLRNISKEAGFKEEEYMEICGETDNMDFRAIYTKDNVKLGITSIGDRHKDVKLQLEYLISKDCDIYVCACRTYDKYGNGTIAAVNSFINLEAEFVPKTYEPKESSQSGTNLLDAKKLWSKIQACIEECL